MKLADAIQITGNLSNPSKMPCHGYNLPAKKCITGQKLKLIKNSVCNQCYAFRNNYIFKNIQKVLEKRLEAIQNPQWVDAMTHLIKVKEQSGYFRWHDSGDLQSVEHLNKIVQIAKNLPYIKFWLPTREYQIVSEYLETYNKFPNNLIVRLSAHMVDGVLPTEIANKHNLLMSGVSRKFYTCPAHSQENKCMSCRNCWDKNHPVVIYRKH